MSHFILERLFSCNFSFVYRGKSCEIVLFGFSGSRRGSSFLACEQADSSRVKVKAVKETTRFLIHPPPPPPPPPFYQNHQRTKVQSLLVGYLFKSQNIVFFVAIH